MEIFKLLNSSAKKLKDKNIISHQLDAEILLSNVLKISREKMLIDSNNKISPKILPYFQKMLNRRLAQEPVAYILNKREFWSQNFSVNKDTLIPRPETELMVDRIVKMFKKKINTPNINLVVAGGVAANISIRENLKKLSREIGFKTVYPNLKFCGDNAAMIAWAGIQRFKKNMTNDVNISAKSRWPLDKDAPYMKGPGLKL